MRIGYTCHDSFPSSSTNTQQIIWTLVEVARLGVSVDLTIPSVERVAGRDPRESVPEYYGVPTQAIPSTFSIRPLGERAPRDWKDAGRFDWRVARHLAHRAQDIIWTRDPLAPVSCLRAGLPTVFETYRPDFATRRRFSVWRRVCLRSPHLRGLILHSQLAARSYEDAGVPAHRCLVAHNGFAPSLLEPVLTRAEARARLGLSLSDQIAVYTGHVGREKGTDAIVQTAAAVPHAKVLIVGVEPGPEQKRLEAVAAQAGTRNLMLRPRVPLKDVATYLYAADCLLIPPTDEPLRRFRRTVLPMKVFMYLAAGRPILAPRLPDIEEVLTDGRTARLVSPSDIRAAGTALADLLADASLQERLSANAREASTQYTWSARARRIVDYFSRQLIAES